MIGYEQNVSSSTPSNDEVVREFLKETIEFDDHVLPRLAVVMETLVEARQKERYEQLGPNCRTVQRRK